MTIKFNTKLTAKTKKKKACSRKLVQKSHEVQDHRLTTSKAVCEQLTEGQNEEKVRQC